MEPVLIHQNESSGSTTTTIDLRQSNRQWNKIRGFSVDILELLNDCGGLTTIELVECLKSNFRYSTNKSIHPPLKIMPCPRP